MALDRDTILADNLKESLNLYQRSIVWAMTAAATFFILTLTLGDPDQPAVRVLWGELSGPAAWFVALGLFLVLGIFATSALETALKTYSQLRVAHSISSQPEDGDMLGALMLYPSLATNNSAVVRIGTVCFSPVIVPVAFTIQIPRETAPRGGWWWLGVVVLALHMWAPYFSIMKRLRHPIGWRSSDTVAADP